MASKKAGELAIQRFENKRAQEQRSKQRQRELKTEALQGISSGAKSQQNVVKSPFNGVGYKLDTRCPKINTTSPLKKTNKEERLILEMVRIIKHSEEFSSDEVQVAKDCFIGIFKNDDGENRTFLEMCYEQVKHKLPRTEVSMDDLQSAQASFEDPDFQEALNKIAVLEDSEAIANAREERELQAALDAIAAFEEQEALAKDKEDQEFQAAIALSMEEL